MLARQTTQASGQSTFRALTRGYVHWASGRVSTISVNVQHPINCHVQSVMKPSMKLFRNSASCTHVSALLHALVSLTSSQFQLRPNESTTLDHLDDETPITSLPCQWKPLMGNQKQKSISFWKTSIHGQHSTEAQQKIICSPSCGH